MVNATHINFYYHIIIAAVQSNCESVLVKIALSVLSMAEETKSAHFSYFICLIALFEGYSG